MAQYNIEMNTYNGSTYDQLYPQTLLENIPVSLDYCPNIENLNEYISSNGIICKIIWFGEGGSTLRLSIPYTGSKFIMIGALHQYDYNTSITPFSFIVVYQGKNASTISFCFDSNTKVYTNCINLGNVYYTFTGEAGRYLNQQTNDASGLYYFYSSFLFGG